MATAKAVSPYADDLRAKCQHISWTVIEHIPRRARSGFQWWYSMLKLVGLPQASCGAGVRNPTTSTSRKDHCQHVEGLYCSSNHPHMPLLPAPAIISPTRQLLTQRPICTLIDCLGSMCAGPSVAAVSMNSVCCSSVR
jgi:hypothetical protein